MGQRKVALYRTSWPLKSPFRITGHEVINAESVIIEIGENGKVGRGEGQGAFYLGETSETILADIEKVIPNIESGITREELLDLIPPSGARNAIDCALWDLEVKLSGKSIWELTGISANEVNTVYTVGMEATPEEMAAKAAGAKDCPILKIKLDGNQPTERMRAIRAARPDAKMVIDANQGFDIDLLNQVLPVFEELDVAMLEQPLPRGADDEIKSVKTSIPLCADESCLHMGELDEAMTKYDMINIKLDKCGGLTEGLMMANKALDAGKKLMVGNMLGSSMSMAPGLVLAQLCDLIDLDGPMNMRYDFLESMTYEGGIVTPPKSNFWGLPD